MRQVIEAETERFQRELMRGSFDGLHPFANPPDVVGRLVQELTGIGAQLDQLVADPNVEEIYGVDGEITVRMAGGETICSENPAQPQAVLAVLQRLITNSGENIDASHPKVDGIRVLLPSGAAGAACPPLSRHGSTAPSLSVCGSPKAKHHTGGPGRLDSLSPEAAAFLGALDEDPPYPASRRRTAWRRQNHHDRGIATGGPAPPAGNMC